MNTWFIDGNAEDAGETVQLRSTTEAGSSTVPYQCFLLSVASQLKLSKVFVNRPGASVASELLLETLEEISRLPWDDIDVESKAAEILVESARSASWHHSLFELVNPLITAGNTVVHHHVTELKNGTPQLIIHVGVEGRTVCNPIIGHQEVERLEEWQYGHVPFASNLACSVAYQRPTESAHSTGLSMTKKLRSFP